MKVCLYLDEDSQNGDLLQALRSRGVDVIGAGEAGLREREDKEHLRLATAQGRVLYSFNARDFHRIHTEYLSHGKSHAGIVLAKQQHYSVGEQMRRLLRLIATKSAEEMKDQIEFLGDSG